MWRLLVASLSSVAAFRIDCEYTGLSGPVAELILGGRKLDFAFNLRSSESEVYAPWECPPFVPSCFNPEFSRTFWTPRIETRKRDYLGWRLGYESSDKLTLVGGAVLDRKFAFNLVTVQEPRRLEFRDVAGYIGMGKNSAFFSGKIVQIKEDFSSENGVSFLVDEPESSPAVIASVPAVTTAEQWIFRLHAAALDGVFLGENIEIVFDLLQQDVVLSSSFIPRIQRLGLKILRDDRLGTTSMTAEIDLRFELGSGVEIGIPPEVLKVPPKELKNRKFQPFRLRIMDELPPGRILIGRALLRSVKFMELDYATKSIGFSLDPLEVHPAPFQRYPVSVPSFEDPFATEQGIQLLEASSADGFFLVSMNHQPKHSGKSEHCWILQRLNAETSQTEQVKQSVSGSFIDAILRIDTRQRKVLLRLIQGQPDKEFSIDVDIHSTYSRVLICVQVISKQHRFLMRNSVESSRKKHWEFRSAKIEDPPEAPKMKIHPGWRLLWPFSRSSRIHTQ